jgi:uncharacterized protein YbjQ (UPF0145 family)
MSNLDTCPSCGSKLKTGILSSNSLVTDQTIELISILRNEPKKIGCQKCLGVSYDKAIVEFSILLDKTKKELEQNLLSFPIATLHSPYNWHYEVIGMVTAQANLGTGIFSELSTSLHDIMGTQSERYNAKILTGEESCKNMLRAKAISNGANAIIGVDIDYSEIGSGKGLVLVCMAGTAVRVSNTEILGEVAKRAIERIHELNEQLEDWHRRIPDIIKGLPNN